MSGLLEDDTSIWFYCNCSHIAIYKYRLISTPQRYLRMLPFGFALGGSAQIAAGPFDPLAPPRNITKQFCAQKHIRHPNIYFRDCFLICVPFFCILALKVPFSVSYSRVVNVEWILQWRCQRNCGELQGFTSCVCCLRCSPASVLAALLEPTKNLCAQLHILLSFHVQSWFKWEVFEGRCREA